MKEHWNAVLDLQQARPSPRGLNAVMAVMFAVAAAISLTTFLDAVRSIGRPFAGFGFTDSLLITPVLIAPDAPDVRIWDEVVALEGQPVTNAPDLANRLAAHAPGTVVPLVVRRGGEPERTVSVRITTFRVRDFFEWHTNQSILALVIIAIGALVWLLRPGAKALTFCLCCLTTGLMCVGGVDGTLFRRFPHLFHMAAPLVPPATLAFALRLSPRLARQRWSMLVWAVPLVLGLSLTVLLMIFNRGPVRIYAALGIAVYAMLVVGSAAFFVVMLDAWRRPDGAVERARAGVILAAWPLGMGIPALNFLLAFAFRSVDFTAIPNAAVLLLPASVAWAIFRQDLFDADLALRRLIADLLLTGAATAVYAVALSLAYSVFTEGAASPAVAIALAALLLALAFPIRDRLKRYVDAVLEGRRYDAQGAISGLARDLATELSLERVLARIEATLSATTRPAQVTALLTQEDDSLRAHALAGKLLPDLAPSVWRGAQLVVARAGGDVDAEDTEGPEGRLRTVALPENVEVVLPLRAAGRDVGALLMGPPKGSSQRYSAADLVFMRTVAGQAAPTLANARAFAEVDRLNRTLEERVKERTLELTSVNDELRDLDRRKDELISTISHDFRSPLSIIRSHVETVLQDPAMDAATRTSFLQVVDRQARRLSSMVENLLDLARIRNRGLSARDIQVAELLRNAADGVRPRMEAAGVACRTELPPPGTLVHGDFERLGQVFQNLLDNASKFTPRGGDVLLYARVDGGKVVMGVKDTGIGIPPADQERICEPFYQVKRAGAEREGSGLGLAIVKEIVERHEASLRLESGPTGTTWEFSLPRVGM